MYVPAFLRHKGVVTGAVVPRRIFNDTVGINVPVNLQWAEVAGDGNLAAAEPSALVAVGSRILYPHAVADAAGVVPGALEKRHRAAPNDCELVAPGRDQERIGEVPRCWVGVKGGQRRVATVGIGGEDGDLAGVRRDDLHLSAAYV